MVGDVKKRKAESKQVLFFSLFAFVLNLDNPLFTGTAAGADMFFFFSHNL
jgi:hypothetical protein